MEKAFIRWEDSIGLSPGVLMYGLVLDQALSKGEGPYFFIHSRRILKKINPNP
jgi:hypothetical protein